LDVDRMIVADPFATPEMKQLECVGPPLQVYVTGLLNPLMGFRVIVYVAVFPAEIVMDVGDTLSVKSVPVPARSRVWMTKSLGDLLSLSVTTIDPTRAPVDAGVRLTVTMQLVLTARFAGQVFPTILNSVFVLTILLIASGAVPRFEITKL
jgi:hypothetical protein